MSNKKIQFKITRDRSHYLSPCYWNGIYQTSPETKKIYGVSLDEEWNYYFNYRMMTIQNEKKWRKAGEYISLKMLNKGYFGKIRKEIKKREKNIIIFLKKIKKADLAFFDFKEIISTVNEIENLSLEYDSANVLSWYVAGDNFLDLIKKERKISEEDYDFIVTPSQKTYVSQLEHELPKYALLIKSGKKELGDIAQILSDNFGWIPFGYDGLEYWDKKYFIKLLKQKIKNYKKITEDLKIIEVKDRKNTARRNKLLKKLSPKERERIKIANYLAIWTDERKKLTFSLFYYYSQCLLRLAKDFDIPYINLKYLFTEELKGLLHNKKSLFRRSWDRIKNARVIYFCNGKYREVSSKEKRIIINFIKAQSKINYVRGFVACRGERNIYKGRVRIVLSSKDGRKIESNDFLVTGMTTPDFMMPMKKAKGFITNEGGVTCHAAIVAREMNKPCIIGTKIATQVLHDGDLVEMDAEKGIVKILKR